MSVQNPPVRSLREHPDLNQLKRQAKELLEAYRAGNADASAEVAHHYREANPETFALHDAQLVLARAYGFTSWPKLKAFVNGATVKSLMAAVRAGDRARVETILRARPEIINMDASDNDEHRALHHAVLGRDAAMVRLLMAHGADARIGIYPHRVPTTPMAIATERGYDDIVAIIQEAEAQRSFVSRRYESSNTPPPPPALMEAIRRGDTAAVIAFLETSPLLQEHPELLTGGGPDGTTLLHIAAARLMPELAAWLLAHGADPNRPSGPRFTPMDMLGRWPVSHPHERLGEISDLLLRHGGQKSAFWAIAMNDGAWLRARHAEGTLKNPVSDVGGLVTYAVRVDRPEMLTLLLDLGLDPDEHPDADTGPLGPDRIGKPLEFCAKHQRPALAEILIRRGATLPASMAVALGMGDWLRARHAAGTLEHPPEGDGLLTTAVEHGRNDMLQLLLDLGFDVEERRRVVGRDEVTESRGNPLARAADKGNLEMAKLLIEHGGDPTSAIPGPYRRRDQAMLDLLMRHGGVVSAGTAAYHRDVAVARERIAQEDAGTLPPGAVGPGHTVAQDLLDGDSGSPEIIRMALARTDWPPDDPRWYGTLKGPLSFWNYVPWIESPLWQVDRTGYLECFKMILARCHANVKGSFGRTILHDVMAMGHHDGASGWITEDEALAFAVTLLDAGARTDVRDDLLKSTPLGWACRWGRAPIVKELLRRGVDPIEPDAEPWATPRAWAEKMGHGEIVALLEESGDRNQESGLD